MEILCPTGRSRRLAHPGQAEIPGAVSVRFGPARAGGPDRQEGAGLDLGKQA